MEVTATKTKREKSIFQPSTITFVRFSTSNSNCKTRHSASLNCQNRTRYPLSRIHSGFRPRHPSTWRYLPSQHSLCLFRGGTITGDVRATTPCRATAKPAPAIPLQAPSHHSRTSLATCLPHRATLVLRAPSPAVSQSSARDDSELQALLTKTCNTYSSFTTH